MLLLKELKRDKTGVLGALITLPDTSQVSKETVEIIFPKFFKNSALYNTDGDTLVLGFVMIKVGKKYIPLKISTLLELGDNALITETVVDNGMGLKGECYVYTYAPGEIIIKSLSLVKHGALTYDLTYKILKRGGVIPYFSKNDILTCLDHLGYLNGVASPEYGFLSIYLETSIRDPKDLNRTARNLADERYINIPFVSLLLTVNNSLSLISGPYTEDGFQKALTTTTERASSIEEVWRI